MTTARRRGAHRRLLLVVTAAIALGILGMHALSAPPAGTSTVHTTVIGAGAGAGAGATPPSDAPNHGTHGTHGTHADSQGDDGAHGSHGDGAGHIMMLCAAMLAAAALLVLGARTRGLTRWWVVLAPAVVDAIAPRPPPGGTGPPAAWRFSVIRC